MATALHEILIARPGAATAHHVGDTAHRAVVAVIAGAGDIVAGEAAMAEVVAIPAVTGAN